MTCRISSHMPSVHIMLTGAGLQAASTHPFIPGCALLIAWTCHGLAARCALRVCERPSPGESAILSGECGGGPAWMRASWVLLLESLPRA